MLKLISCLLVYLVSVGIWGFATYLSYKLELHIKSKLALVGLVVAWSGLIFNIVYTGIMGWNFTPASDLEALLDSITFIIEVVGIGLWYIGFTVFQLKKK